MAHNGLKERFVWNPCGAEKPHYVFALFGEIDDPFNGASAQAPPLAADLHLDIFGNFTCQAKSLLRVIAGIEPSLLGPFVKVVTVNQPLFLHSRLDQIKSFRRFLLFARDTIQFRRPMDPDIHWSAMSGHVSTFIVNGGSYDKIIWTEKFNEGMADVLSSIKTPHSVDLETIPRFNESEGHGPKRAHPVEDYFDDMSMHLVYEIFKRDFEVFKYDFKDPSNKMPIGEIDLDEVHKKLGD
jgi:hypothetical protein